VSMYLRSLSFSESAVSTYQNDLKDFQTSFLVRDGHTHTFHALPL